MLVDHTWIEQIELVLGRCRIPVLFASEGTKVSMRSLGTLYVLIV